MFVGRKRRGAGSLNRLEDPDVHDGLYQRKTLDQISVSGDPPQTPPGHIIRLGERVKLERYSVGSLDLQNARRTVPVKGDLAVSVIVDEHRIVPTAKVHHMPEVLGRGRRCSGIVRIVEVHQPKAGPHIVRDFVERYQVVVLRAQRH